MTDYSGAIRAYVASNRTPDQELCPRIVQFWKTANGKVYWDSTTGERTNYRPASISEYGAVSVRSEYYGMYVKYIPEIKALEISGVMLEGNRGKDGEIKEWSYGVEYRYNSRYFMFKDTTDVYDSAGYRHFTSKKYVNEVMKEHIHRICNTACGEEAIQEINKFINGDVNNFFRYHWNYGYKIKEWYDRYAYPRTQVKTNNLLTDYELEDEEFETVTEKERVMTFTKLDDNWCVLRVYRWRNCDYWTKTIDKTAGIREVGRCYINAKGKASTACEYNDEWIMKSSNIWECDGDTELINYDSFLEWTPLKYVLPIIEEPNMYKIINMLRHPVVEQMIKAGYPNIAKKICKRNEIAANLKYEFLIKSERKLPLFKLLGVNKEEMRVEDELLANKVHGWSNSIQFIRELKQLYGRFDISDLSKETIATLRLGYEKAGSFFDLCVMEGFGWGRYRSEHKYTEEEFKRAMKICKAEQKHEGTVELFRDTLGIYNRIRRKPDIDISKFDNYNDLMRIHDALIDINTAEERERQASYNASQKERLEKLKKSFEKLQEERIAKYEYDEDGSEFCIRVPHVLDEIREEGIALSHCVGGYTDRHALGETNIIFLRRKDSENRSFYTIEIKGNRVAQIHGSHNKWLGNNPEAIPFVYRYLKKLGVNFDKMVLLNKGMGYCASNENLPESYLTAA